MIQHIFLKPSMVNLISKDANLVHPLMCICTSSIRVENTRDTHCFSTQIQNDQSMLVTSELCCNAFICLPFYSADISTQSSHMNAFKHCSA